MRKLILLLAVFFAAFSIQTKAQTTVSIGSGTGTSNFIPIYYLYDYSYSQTIYTAAELTGGGAPAPGYINKIRYKSKAAVASTSNWKDWEIYIANTSKTSFTGVTDYISSSSMTMVFDGTLPASLTANDWIELTFSTPFLWDGSSNVVVAVRDKTLGWGTAPTWAGYTLAPPSGSKGIYFYQDNTTIDPTSPTALYTGATNTVAQIQLEMGSATPCSGMPTAGSATSSTTNACSGAPFSLGLSGQTQASGLTYQWQSATSSSGPWSDIVGATTLSYTTSQTTTTWYRCKVACGSDEAISDALEVTTPSLIGGTYTINDALPTGGGNFASFADAISYIGCGINAPVVFNVEPGSGPYLEQVVINPIGGASATNTVTFNGNGATIQYSSSNSAARAGIHLNGADHIIIDSLNIDGSAGTYAWGIVLTNRADSNIIRKCTINVGSNVTTSNYLGIIINGSATTTSTAGNNGNGNLIENNHIVGGYYGMFIYGGSTFPSDNNNNKIIGNTIEDYYYYAMYVYYQSSGLVISKNDISRPTRTTVTTTYGLYIGTGSVGALIEKNRIHNLFDGAPNSTSLTYCLYLLTDGTAANPTRVENNAIYSIGGNGSLYGLYNSGAAYMKAYHNTISLDNTAATAGATYGFYQVTSDNGIEFKNNIVNITRGGSGAKYCIYKSTAATPIASDNNVLYVNSAGSGAQNIGYQTTAQATLTDWQTATSQDGNSISVDPLFADPTMGDYTPTESQVDDMGAPLGVMTDILDSTRSAATPDPGAWELAPVAGIDIKPESLYSPTESAEGCYNTETLVVRVKNSGTQDINFATNNLTVTISVTGAATATYSATVTSGMLVSGATQDITMATPGATLDMSVVGQYSFEITTNLVGDINPANNTITKTREKIALSGGTATVSQSDLCVSGVPPTLSSTLVEGYTSVQWQSSTTSGSGFSDIAGATSIDYTLPSIPGTNMYYRLVATCGTNTSNSSEIGVTVNDPQLTSTTPGSHCGPGSVNLGATATGGYTVNWYENPTGGVAIGTGSTFTTPPITSTTTFYAAASTGPGGPTTAQIGNGSSVSTSYEGPYYHLYGNKLSQYLFLASELTTAGMTAGTINSIAFDVVAPGVSYNNFTIGLKATNASVMTNTLESGLTTVYSSASETPVAGINTYTFTTPFVWDGVSNVIVQVCWTNNNNGGTSATVKYETTSFVSNGYWREDGAPVDFCTKTAGYGTTSSRPNTVFGFSNICEGVRTPVVATITSAPAITASATVDTICNGNSTTLSVTSSNSTYAYSWEPGTLIGATQTVSPTATTKYIVNAIDNSGGSFNGCTSIDSVTIAVYNPVPVTINTTATEVCATSNPAIKMFVGLTDIPVLSEDFETGAIDWTTTNNSTGGTPANAAWTIHPSPTTLSAQSVSSNDNSHFYHTNSDAQGSGSQANTTLTSPTFSTVGFTTLSLEFYHYYRHLTAPAAFVKVSTDGGNTWTTVYTSPNATVGGPSAFVKETINLDAFIDKQTVNIQFAYITTGWWYGWAIDNVLVSGTAVGSPSWAPTTGLFTDAAATTPYTGGIADTVYALPTATTTYTASVTTPGNCISSESVTITDTCSVVPVTFTSFTGKKEGTVNVLSWTTATEVNNAGYELQRSADGKQFSKLDFIATKAENGNSNTALSYGYNDNKPLAGNNYYRLKQMDKDGKSSYSNVVILKGDKANQVSITGVYPNPTRNTLNVNIASPSSERVSIVITDISGKVLVQQNVELNAGDNVKQIDVSRLSQGTYLIKTICANGCESAVTKFAKY